MFLIFELNLLICNEQKYELHVVWIKREVKIPVIIGGRLTEKFSKFSKQQRKVGTKFLTSNEEVVPINTLISAY